jgi:hypothetical protein
MTASEVILYGRGYSTYTRTSRLTLEEKDVRHRLVGVDFLRGANKTPEHLSRHPFGKVPVLEHGDLRLYETAAIADCIDSAFPGTPLQPKDAGARARMLQVIGIVVSYIYAPMVGQILVERMIKPLLGQPTDEAAVDAGITLTISLADAGGGTDVLAVHDGLPRGVPAADNEAGWRQALAKLAALVEELPDAARRVQQALVAAGIPAEVLQLPRSARTASDAAAAIGCRVERIAKSLVFRRADSDRPVHRPAAACSRDRRARACRRGIAPASMTRAAKGRGWTWA